MLVFLGVALGFWLGRLSAPAAAPAWQSARVLRALDGDTIEIEGGERIRYIGIDAPELGSDSNGPACYAPEAEEKNRELVRGKTVELLSDAEDRDQHGRLLRYVFVDGVFVNAELARLGYAEARSFAPNLRFRQLFTQLAHRARLDGLGLWSACPF
ncbi:MAG: thermonuclease family protein [Anaerolineae bacterium]